MNPTVKARFSAHAKKLLAEGGAVLANRIVTHEPYTSTYVDPQSLNKWLFGCRNLVSQIGGPAQTWDDAFIVSTDESFETARIHYGRLHALVDAIDDDMLSQVEGLLTADAFGSLLEQASELLEKSYTLAAGVLGRAVLEEHLRKLCDRYKCLPAGRPTIGDLNHALYGGKHLDKLAMKQVDVLADIGNHCAHNNKPERTPAEVQKFLADLHDFLNRHPLP